MKKCFLMVLLLGVLSVLSAAEQNTDRLPTISAEAEVSAYVSANECYVLFLLEGSGETMRQAQQNFNRKLIEFTTTAKKDFPLATFDLISVNIGTRNFSSYRSAENTFTPNITKLLIFILPPDENMAINLLESGVKAGLVPFCGGSRDGSYGAIFYGLNHPETALDKLYPETISLLMSRGKKLAAQLQCEIVKMDDISRFVPRVDSYELCFKEIKAVLPSEFCSADKDKIKISLTLRANFIVRTQKTEK